MVTRSWLTRTRDKDGLVKNSVNDIAIVLQPVVHLDRFLDEQSSILSHHQQNRGFRLTHTGGHLDNRLDAIVADAWMQQRR